MIPIDIIAVGRMRKGPQLSLWDEYFKRIKSSLTLYEIEPKKPGDEEKKILEKIDPHAFIFIMDERGKSLKSMAFSNKLNELSLQGFSRFQFIIGGADGHSDAVRARANFLLSFGNQTWPHMLARIMLIEQVYRAQQIIAGHPYHRE